MESKAIMELGEYAAPVRENEALKALLRACRGKMAQETLRCIREYEIRDMGREECERDLSPDDGSLVGAHAYVNSLRSVAEPWPCFAWEEILASAAETTRKDLGERLDDLLAED